MNKLTIFDLDHTLMNANSSFWFGVFLYRKGFFSFFSMVHCLLCYGLLGLFVLTLDQLHGRIFDRFFRGRNLEEVEKEVETFLEKSFHALLYQPVIQRLREAQERTDRVVILSSSPHFLVGPIARKLGVVDWEATRYGCDAEGRMDRVDSVLGGDSKAALLKRWLDQSFVSTEQVTVYSDSLEDLSLLEAAGKAIVVRPRGRLKKIAEQCAWEILNE